MNVHIAVIDDGINEKYYNTGKLRYNIEIMPDLTVRKRAGYDPFSPSHGTVCAAVIKKYSPDAVLSSVKILEDETKMCIKAQLCRAIEWCTDNGIDIANLSLGSIYFKDFEDVRDAVNRAAAKGLIIVAACNNRDIYTVPASLANVIGVKCDKCGILEQGEYLYNYCALDGIEITACGSNSLINYAGKSRTVGPANSFAAPLVTSKVYDLILDNPGISLEEIKHKLAEKVRSGGQIYRSPNFYRNTDWIKKAVLFDLCRGDYPEVPCKIPIKERRKPVYTNFTDGLNTILKYIGSNKTMLEDIDTIIIKADNVIPENISREVEKILYKVLFYGMNLVYLNDNDKHTNLDFTGQTIHKKVWCPHIQMHIKVKGHMEIDIPIVVIYDFTGKEFIKMSNNLKVLFNADGYNAFVATNSCLGVISGLDYLCGDSKDRFKNEINIIYDIYDPDIIIIGLNLLIDNISCFSKVRADIGIFISDSCQDNLKPLICKNEDCYTITLLNPIEQVVLNTKDIRHIDFDNYIAITYNTIKQLFTEPIQY